jgi:hypothetical protein
MRGKSAKPPTKAQTSPSAANVDRDDPGSSLIATVE